MIIKAPWTQDQVRNLKKHQDDMSEHPYTCMCGESLVPTTNGWVCDECSYKQDWAYDFHLNNSAIMPELEESE